MSIQREREEHILRQPGEGAGEGETHQGDITLPVVTAKIQNVLCMEVFRGSGSGMGQRSAIAGGMADAEDEAVMIRAEHTGIGTQKGTAAQGVEHILGGDKLRREGGGGTEKAQILRSADGAYPGGGDA